MDPSQHRQRSSRGSGVVQDSHLRHRPLAPEAQAIPSLGVHAFGLDAVFSEADHLPYSHPSRSSSDTYFDGSSDGRSSTFTTDFGDSSYASFELTQWQSTNLSPFLPPGRQTLEPPEYEPAFAAGYRQTWPRSLPIPPSRPLAPHPPLRHFSNDHAAWYQRAETQAPPSGDPRHFIRAPTRGGEPIDRQQSASFRSPVATLVREVEGQPYRCQYWKGNKRCNYYPSGKNYAHLLKIHEMRQHKSSHIPCEKEGCNIVIANGRRDNLRKHHDSENCAGFRKKKKAPDVAEKLPVDELAGQPSPPSSLPFTIGSMAHEDTLQPLSPNLLLMEDFCEAYRQIEAGEINDRAGFYR
ncbi:hypothetical protein B0H67DRAFT_305165 [Lasiosphaeris hirsuta]|uniref:Uncharacterized protein n=1 Tax=Lasiosphaeris hirsuta TaxID=260670 RepID=A0AA40AA09_9PEZI|nr:hypothetical protein B0H67DRAFT_305165 [Lasiosphaeris hirsuta]